MQNCWLYTSAVICLCVIGWGNALECYSCQIVEGITKGNPCKKPSQCPGNSVCLSASFALESDTGDSKISSTFKTCVPKEDGRHCDKIEMLGDAFQIKGYKANFNGGCYTCDTDGCNGSSSSYQFPLSFLLITTTVTMFFGAKIST